MLLSLITFFFIGVDMSEEEKLKVYLERLKVLAEEKLDNKITAMQALKESLNIIEGELTGY